MESHSPTFWYDYTVLINHRRVEPVIQSTLLTQSVILHHANEQIQILLIIPSNKPFFVRWGERNKAQITIPQNEKFINQNGVITILQKKKKTGKSLNTFWMKIILWRGWVFCFRTENAKQKINLNLELMLWQNAATMQKQRCSYRTFVLRVRASEEIKSLFISCTI